MATGNCRAHLRNILRTDLEHFVNYPAADTQHKAVLDFHIAVMSQ
jgi:hypothetical protein